MISDMLSHLELRTATQKFLEMLCVQDRKGITEKVHKNMMKCHFYYVDYQNQGWYVLEDDRQFHRKLTDSEYWVYGELWQNATAYE